MKETTINTYLKHADPAYARPGELEDYKDAHQTTYYVRSPAALLIHVFTTIHGERLFLLENNVWYRHIWSHRVVRLKEDDNLLAKIAANRIAYAIAEQRRPGQGGTQEYQGIISLERERMRRAEEKDAVQWLVQNEIIPRIGKNGGRLDEWVYCEVKDVPVVESCDFAEYYAKRNAELNRKAEYRRLYG